MLIKKHFDKIAWLLNKTHQYMGGDEFEDLVSNMIDFCRDENSTFDEIKFLKKIYEK